MASEEDAAQQAWAKYVNSAYIDPDCIQAVHRAWMVAYKVGWSEGYETAEHA